MDKNPRFRLRLGARRISVTLDPLMCGYLALYLGYGPDTREARRAVRRWLQQRLDANADPHRVAVRRWLQQEILIALVDPRIAQAYDRWQLEATSLPY